MSHTVEILEMLGGFVAAEIPLFMLLLHISNRIIKLETQIYYLTEAIKK